MALTGVEITGDKELDRLLRDMPDNLRDKHLKAASAAVIRYVVQPKARAALSSVVGRKTGNLAKSLKNYGVRKKAGWPVAWKLKVTAPHFRLIEFGTKDRQTKRAYTTPSKKTASGWGFGRYRGRIMPGKFAFLRKALYGSEKEAKQAFVKAIRAFIAEQSTKAKFAKKAILG